MRSTIAAAKSGNAFSTTDLDKLERQLNAWRRKRPGRVRLPSQLWDSAAWLARSRGVSQVSRRLGLDYYKLNRWLGPIKEFPQDVAPPTFVELAVADPGRLGVGHQFRAEMGKPAGCQLTLHLGGDVSAIVALAEAFWRQKQ